MLKYQCRISRICEISIAFSPSFLKYFKLEKFWKSVGRTRGLRDGIEGRKILGKLKESVEEKFSLLLQDLSKRLLWFEWYLVHGILLRFRALTGAQQSITRRVARATRVLNARFLSLVTVRVSRTLETRLKPSKHNGTVGKIRGTRGD